MEKEEATTLEGMDHSSPEKEEPQLLLKPLDTEASWLEKTLADYVELRRILAGLDKRIKSLEDKVQVTAILETSLAKGARAK